MDAFTWLVPLLTDVEIAVDVEEPEDVLREGDERLGRLPDGLIVIWRELQIANRRIDVFKERLRAMPEGEQKNTVLGEATSLDQRSDILYKLFWYGVRAHFNLWERQDIGVGISKGWEAFARPTGEEPCGFCGRVHDGGHISGITVISGLDGSILDDLFGP